MCGALAVVLNAILASHAQAHDFWLEPSSYRPAAEAPFTISFREGNGEGDALPRNEGRLARFELLGPGGAEPVPGVDGAHPAGALPGLAAGTWVVLYANTPAPHVLPAERFEAYLAEKGLEHVSELRAERRATGEPGRERYFRCAKAVLAVGDGGPGHDTPTRPVGLTLELVPAVDPTSARPGDELEVRAVFRGRPLAGLLISALGRDQGSSVDRRTDEDGVAHFAIDGPGRWLLRAVHMTEAPPGLGVEWESWWASLAFEVAGGR